ncbi:RNA recognition motif domain-containing protein [Phthorimaea operculella]|nr:RNA recognition motif domain-containing protein [Phthorimaea operculella]
MELLQGGGTSMLQPPLPGAPPVSLASLAPPGPAMPGVVPGVAQVPGAAPGSCAPGPTPAAAGGLFYDLQQHGDVYTGPGARCSTLPAILGGSLPRLSSEQADAVARAKKYAMEQSIKMVLMKQTLAHQQQQMATQRTQVQRQQALALMCRVYVGSISFELKEDTIRQAFLPFGPIKSINMSWDPVTQKHKGFAFVEYEIPEAAQLSLEQMNGVMLGGRNIKVVGRPSNMPQAQAVIDEIQEEAKQYNRIYVASIHPELTEDDIKNVFEAFGPITYCKLAYGASAHKHKGYGFIEYATLPAALEAIASMNLFDLGGQYLRIQAMDAVAQNAVTLGLTKLNALGVPPSAALPSLAAALPGALPATLPTIPTIPTIPTLAATIPTIPAIPTLAAALPGALPAAAIPAVIPPPGVVIPPPPASLRPPPPQPAHYQAALQKKLLDSEPDTLQQQESLSISGQSARHLVMQRLMRRRASRTVLLCNMVRPEEVDEALHHEIQEECGKWGVVQRLVIYNERQSEDDDPNNAQVKIFVQFQQPEEASAAAGALNGRYFGGRTVRAQLYDQDLFDHGDLSG